MDNVTAAYLAGIIDGEGTITLTKLHKNEFRRPIITIASTDFELLSYLKSILRGSLINKKNYSPERHKNSYTLILKNKNIVMSILHHILPYLRVSQKQMRAKFIIEHYEKVTPRNGKYTEDMLKKKQQFEKNFFLL